MSLVDLTALRLISPIVATAFQRQVAGHQARIADVG
jgi:hypothetical protein